MLNIMITSINFIVLFYFVKLEIPQRLFSSDLSFCYVRYNFPSNVKRLILEQKNKTMLSDQ